MIYFFTTSKVDRHSHIAYLNKDLGGGILLEAKGHTHDLVLAEDGSLIVAPAEDGHTHAIASYQYVDMRDDLTEEELVSEVKSNFKAWYDLQAENIEKGVESIKYYKGEQWDTERSKTLSDNNRCVLTINEILPNIDVLLGYHRDNRTDWLVLPKESGDNKIADLSTELLKHISITSKIPQEEDEVFRDMCITGRGIWDVFVDFENNIEGEVRATRFKWDEVVFAEHSRSDLEDCEGMIKYKFVSKQKLKQLYPDKADDIEADSNVLSDAAVKTTRTNPGNDYRQTNVTYHRAKQMIGDKTYYDPIRKEYLILERSLKVYREVTLIVDANSGDIFSLEGWKKSDINKIKKAIDNAVEGDMLYDLQVVVRRVPRIRVTTVAGNVLLADEFPADFPQPTFYTIPAYAYFIDGDWFGKVETAKGPQDQINKSYSHAVDILNRMCAYIWFYDSTTFNNPKAKKDFIEHSAKPGATFEVDDLNNVPVRIEGTKFPQELAEMLQLSSQKLTQILNIVPEQETDFTSGTAFLLRRETKITGNTFLYENAGRAKAEVGKRLLSLIQRYYSVSRINRIVNQSPPEIDPQTGQPLPPRFSIQDIKKFKRDTDLVNYDIVVTEAEFAPSAMMGMFATLTALANQGQAITPDAILPFAPVPAEMKDQVIGQIQQQQAMQQEQEQQVQDSEIVKSLIGQGIIPPEIQKQYQIEDQVAAKRQAEVSSGTTGAPLPVGGGGPVPPDGTIPQ